MDTHADDSEPSWGAKVNTRNDFDPRQRQACPTWADWKQKKKWTERGLVVWNHATHQVVRLHSIWALDVLDKLRANADWQHNGFTIGEPVLLELPHFDETGKLAN